MASSGGQQPATTTRTHEIQTQNQSTHLANSSSALAPNTTTSATTTTGTSSVNGRKRALDYDGTLQGSPYFKMRLIVQEIRPLVLDVLRSPDFQNCEAAQELQQKLKLTLDLCKQNTVENAHKPVTLNRNTRVAGNNLEKPETNRISGTYIVGGSAFGWNFITFHGTKPEYYGRTKEEFRAGK